VERAQLGRTSFGETPVFGGGGRGGWQDVGGSANGRGGGINSTPATCKPAKRSRPKASGKCQKPGSARDRGG
jgi:hypothetical protein